MTTTSTLQPNWPVPAHVRSACSLRTGGVSLPPYDSLNLGDHVGDEASAVALNREIYANTLQAKPVYLKQVHGFDVVRLDAHTPDGTVADACFTTEKNVACTIMVADCLPVLFRNREGTVVGAAHAGWRGLCGEGGQGVLEQVFKHFEALAGKDTAQSATKFVANDWLVWLGPCIGPTAFEVGAEVREAFVAADAQAQTSFKSHGEKYLADLPALARQRLTRMGITQIYGNDGSLTWCTVSNSSNFFSHRRDRVSGRFAASVWLT
ncbi:peptidoglycan editing factor PgeF [Variovorax sp. PCZ-1]|uniref:peptidoglycan editing factor PgeF n=1 Tax=Variovorax sp. PCZ-1 TaxID=2835533 RepID=UPI001BCDEC3E|nr:peptidoglycan editing factor PgeF [Variovorax sp. PCZ-1]MBS7808532.1 peptidoglycan editing factor PgeF [Variovorax sp. PCZ-1]